MKIGLQTWGSEGDIRPFLNLSDGLLRAGHEVRLLITEVVPRDDSREAALGDYVLEEAASPVFKNDAGILLMEQRVKAASNPVSRAMVIVEDAFDPSRITSQMRHSPWHTGPT